MKAGRFVVNELRQALNEATLRAFCNANRFSKSREREMIRRLISPSNTIIIFTERRSALNEAGLRRYLHWTG
jgi:hypothetical protein